MDEERFGSEPNGPGWVLTREWKTLLHEMYLRQESDQPPLSEREMQDILSPRELYESLRQLESRGLLESLSLTQIPMLSSAGVERAKRMSYIIYRRVTQQDSTMDYLSHADSLAEAKRKLQQGGESHRDDEHFFEVVEDSR